MGVTCQILIKSPKEGKHIIGQSINGCVKFALSKPREYKKISLSLISRETCDWAQKTNNSECMESLVIEKIITDPQSSNIIVNAGTYKHPFEILLPVNIPPTVTTDKCKIYYQLVFKFQRANRNKPLKEFRTRNIMLFPNVPLSIPDQQITFGVDKTLLKLFSTTTKTQTVRLKAKLENGYLRPGRDSKLSLVVTNDSDVLTSIKTELISKIVYTDGSGNIRKEEAVIKELNTPEVLKHSIANLFNVITVNADWYTVRCSNLISREYKIKVTLKVPLPHINATMEMPVVIGERINEEDILEEMTSRWEVMSECCSENRTAIGTCHG